MSEIRVRVPREMKEWLEQEAKRMGWTVTGVALLALWERKERTESGVIEDKKRTNRGVRAAKFKPPTLEEVDAERVAKGYHFDGKEFMAHYQGQGWKLGSGRPMTDWRSVMVGWEGRWKEKHEGNAGAAVGRQEYDTSGNRELVEAIKAGKGW